MRAAAATMLAGALLVAAGCSGSEDDRAETPTPTPTPTRTPTGTPDAPEAQPGGAGDEEPIRQPVRITVGPDGVRPRLVKVTAFFGVRLVVRNTSSREQLVTVLGAEPQRSLSVGKGVTANLDLEPLPRGRYVVDAGAAGRGTLVSSLDEP